MPSLTNQDKPETDIVGTLMSLTVAFTLAMAFRGFVLEGFVIPTGSMGPTLMGAHVRLRSPITGFEYPVDGTPAAPSVQVVDPMFSPTKPIGELDAQSQVKQVRGGDRVLVLKPLYAFSEPERWDVVVFKVPTDPVGASQNYIKRLVGLPGEQFLVVDGDVFTGPPDADKQRLTIQRKPEHVQRAVWQPVHDSDYQPIPPLDALEKALSGGVGPNPSYRWDRGPWRVMAGDAAKWSMAPSRAWSYAGTGRTMLSWDIQPWPIDDWNCYNAVRMAADAARRSPRGVADIGTRHDMCYSVSDLRLCASLETADLRGFSTTFRLTARSNRFDFALSVDQGLAGTMALARRAAGGEDAAETRTSFPFRARPDGHLAVEFWHVDQQLWAFVDGTLVGTMPYEFTSLDERVTCSLVGRTPEQYARQANAPRGPTPPRLEWTIDSGAPVTLHRVRVDRDLYYRPDMHSPANQFAVNGDLLGGAAFGTDYAKPERLGADDFVLLGDNSAASRDSRLWGRPHAITLRTCGDAQPGIVPRDLIIGKAWCVYFPATVPGWPEGWKTVLDFGRVRIIR
jgi:signal peptidase I